MAMIQWNEKMSVNVAEIDEQHQYLVSLLNDLSDAMELGRGRDITGQILVRLSEYATVHFRTEEQYFKQFNYAEAEFHILEHEAFTRNVQEFKTMFEVRKLGISVKVLNFLREWLLGHIMKTDKQYSEFFNAKGLT